MTKVAVITGGAAGLGKGFVKQFVSDGFDVVFCDLNKTAGEAVAADFGATFVKVDVSKADEVESFFDQVKRVKGRLDILINNAGVIRGGFATDATPLDTYHLITNININGTFYVAKFGAKLMLDSGRGGSIVNMSSAMALGARAAADGGLGTYAMSKCAIGALTQQMALEYAKHGIRTNAVAPNRTATEMVTAFFKGKEEMMAAGSKENPLEAFFGHMIQVEDVAGIVAFLCSDKAKWINGTILPVDGGYGCG